MNKQWLTLILGMITLSSCSGQKSQDSYDAMLDKLYSHSIPKISTDSLAELQRKNRAFVLLDTRTKEEFRISHINGARFIEYDEFKLDDVSSYPKDTGIVIYCAVGYRSEKVGEELKAAGYDKVSNLYGGIFQWVNDGYPVYHQDTITDQVHGYNRLWGQWVQDAKVVY